MATSKILCMKCGTRLATITKPETVRFMPGTVVERLFREYAVVRCQCGEERKIRYPERKAA